MRSADRLVLCRWLQKRLAGRMIAGELTAHFRCAPGEEKPVDQSATMAAVLDLAVRRFADH